MIIDQLPEISAVQDTDEIPVERGTTIYKATLQKLKDLIGYSLGGIANGVQAISYGGDNGVEFRIYGSDDTIYSLVVYVNAIALNVSYDGGQTWQSKWVFPKDAYRTTVFATLTCESVSTDAGTRNAWRLGNNLPPFGGNLTLTVRNASTGGVHVIWYYSDDNTFEVAATLVGNAPNVGDVIYVTYQA